MTLLQKQVIIFCITVLASILVLMTNIAVIKFFAYLQPLDIYIIFIIDLLIVCAWVLFFCTFIDSEKKKRKSK